MDLDFCTGTNLLFLCFHGRHQQYEYSGSDQTPEADKEYAFYVAIHFHFSFGPQPTAAFGRRMGTAQGLNPILVCLKYLL